MLDHVVEHRFFLRLVASPIPRATPDPGKGQAISLELISNRVLGA